MLAAMHGKIACVEKLLEAGANVCENFSSCSYYNLMSFDSLIMMNYGVNSEKILGTNV